MAASFRSPDMALTMHLHVPAAAAKPTTVPLRRRSKEVDHGQSIGQRGAKGSAASQQHYGRPGAQRYTTIRSFQIISRFKIFGELNHLKV